MCESQAHDLKKFTDLYGMSSLIRMMEIKAPKSEEVFIRRLYKELDEIIISVERGRKERCEDEENRLSSEIVNCLKSAGYHSENDPMQGGHVDFLVEPEQNRTLKWYGEAKIWHGPKYLNDGITQLLSRYASGRQGYLGFVVYFKTDDMVGKMSEWSSHLTKQADVLSIEDSTSTSKFSFCSTHKHSTGSQIKIQHLAVNVHWNPK